jgi:hypothetical protein
MVDLEARHKEGAGVDGEVGHWVLINVGSFAGVFFAIEAGLGGRLRNIFGKVRVSLHRSRIVKSFWARMAWARRLGFWNPT